MKSLKKKTKIVLMIVIIIVLICPFYISYSKTDDTFRYLSILFSYEKSMLGSNEPRPLDESYSVVNYTIETKVKILFITVYDNSTYYEGWLPSD